MVLDRDSGVDIILGDPKVSHHHAEIRVTPYGARLRDLGSTNGTFVAGKQETDVILTNTAIIMVVSAFLMFHSA